MGRRERTEDLGRILELTKVLSDYEIFDNKYWSRPKDACDWFGEQTDEKKDDVIHDIAYTLQDISFKLSEIWAIAAGADDLNCNDRDYDKN